MPGILLSNQPAYAKRVVAGVEWTTASVKDFKSTRGKLRSDGFEVISLTSGNPQTKDLVNYGVVNKSQLPRQGQTIALGAWLANTFRSGTVLALEKVELMRQEDAVFWLCIVNDGQVVTGTDALIEDWDAAVEIAGSTIEALGTDAVGYVGAEASELPFNDQEDESPALAEVLIKSAAQKSILKGAGGNQSLRLLVGGTAIMCGLGAPAYYFINQSMKESETAQKAEQRREQQQQRAQREYQDILNEVGGMNSAGRSVRSFWVNPIQPAMGKVKGWEMESLMCEKSVCSFEYVNTDLTLPGMLKSAIGDRCTALSFIADGTSATCKVKVSAPPLLPSNNGSGQIVESQLQDIVLDTPDIVQLQADFMTVASLGDGTAYAINEAIEYPFSGSRYLPLVQMWDQGEWGLTFPIKYMEAVSGMLGQYRGVALNSLKINWSARIVELQGLYFSQKEGAE